MKTLREKMNTRFRNITGELFPQQNNNNKHVSDESPASTTLDVMSWADPFYPDKIVPEAVKQAMLKAITAGLSEHYASPSLKFELNELISKKVANSTGLHIDPARNVLVTPGSDAGLFYAMMPFIHEGDEVLVPDPSYPKNFQNPELLGGRTVAVPLYEEDLYQLRIEELQKRVTSRTKMLILCHPNNPTTTVYREQTLRDVARFVLEHDLILLCDQAFEDHIYDDIPFISPSTLPGMWKRTLTVCSTSKGIGLSGFRIGYIITHKEIMETLHGGAGNVLGAASTLSIIGAIAAIKNVDHLHNMYTQLENRRNLAQQILRDIPGVLIQPSESGILSWLNVSALGTGLEVSEYIKEHAHVEVNAGEQYGQKGAGHIRVVTGCYHDENTAAQIIQRIRVALIQLGWEKGF